MQGPPHVIYAHIKFSWSTGSREETLEYLKRFTESLSRDVERHTSGGQMQMLPEQIADFTKLLARCYFKQGEWQVALQSDWGAVCIFFYIIR